jgi:hypothetical protein
VYKTLVPRRTTRSVTYSDSTAWTLGGGLGGRPTPAQVIVSEYAREPVEARRCV